MRCSQPAALHHRFPYSRNIGPSCFLGAWLWPSFLHPFSSLRLMCERQLHHFFPCCRPLQHSSSERKISPPRFHPVRDVLTTRHPAVGGTIHSHCVANAAAHVLPSLRATGSPRSCRRTILSPPRGLRRMKNISTNSIAMSTYLCSRREPQSRLSRPGGSDQLH